MKAPCAELFNSAKDNFRRMSQWQLKVSAAGKFILRHFLGNRGILFSSEKDGESPEIPVTDDLPEMFLRE